MGVTLNSVPEKNWFLRLKSGFHFSLSPRHSPDPPPSYQKKVWVQEHGAIKKVESEEKKIGWVTNV